LKAKLYHYFLTCANTIAYRAQFRQSEQEKSLGTFTITKRPEMFYCCKLGWQKSIRYSNPEDFQCGIDSGVLRRVPMLTACAAVDADIVLFAPTLSSRLTSKPPN